ncbi:MAG: pyridoxal phosphate-dependent aminotransferase [Acidobacteria bacterium]|nr:pyridoxal phosphate-dependent aminotransferase [Acidobacteriota bacterium]
MMIENPPFPPSIRVQRMQASSTLAVVQAAARLRAQGIEVIDLGAGEPDFPTPEHIKQAAHQAINENFTKYTPAAGIPELKQAIIERLFEDYGVQYTPPQVIATAGGKQAIFNAVVALINPGDEVLIPSPYWVTFPEIVTFAEGKSVFIDTEPTGFQFTPELFEAHISARTKLLILNSPCNPTGRAILPDTYRRIVEMAAERQVYVIADECYREFVYPPAQPFCAGQLPPELKRWVLVSGTLSKTYAMTGWRLGYALGDQRWIDDMVKVQSHSTSNPTSISQKAGVAALRGPRESIRMMLEEYQRRRDFLIPALNAIPGIECNWPEGAFYAFPNIEKLLNGSIKTSEEAQLRLLEDYHVALTPGSAFGLEGYLRISYANSMDALRRGVEQIRAFVDGLK